MTFYSGIFSKDPDLFILVFFLTLQYNTNMKQRTASKLGKDYVKAVIFCLYNWSAEYIMQNAGLDEAQAGIKISGRTINSLRYADYTTLMAEKWKWRVKKLA